jgi:hypothetical protein
MRNCGLASDLRDTATEDLNDYGFDLKFAPNNEEGKELNETSDEPPENNKTAKKLTILNYLLFLGLAFVVALATLLVHLCLAIAWTQLKLKC